MKVVRARKTFEVAEVNICNIRVCCTICVALGKFFENNIKLLGGSIVLPHSIRNVLDIGLFALCGYLHL
jgi:hypothetical protein